MKKNKKLLTVLVFLLIVIWGLVFFRVVQSGSTMNNNNFLIKTRSDKNLDIVMDKLNFLDTSMLLLNYRDPFLQESNRDRKVVFAENNPMVKKINKKAVKKSGFDWTSIRYLGSINNNISKNKIGIFQFNSKELLIKENGSLDTLRILKIYQDSAKLKCKNEIKVIKKNS